MNIIFISLYLCLVYSEYVSNDAYELDEILDSIPNYLFIDPEMTLRVLSSTNIKQQRKLGGVYGLCADNVNIPLHGGLVCDPPNRLPQICTLVCKKGYYSSGLNRDIACADAMCEGQCISNKYDCVGSDIKFDSRPCTYTRYTQCSETESGLCLEDVTEQCQYSYYEEVRRPCCNITAINPPEGCWTSGCTGNCDSPGVYHYYSSSCGDVCPPWRDPDVPQFMCSPCRVPSDLPVNSEIIASNSESIIDIPSEITVGCSPGFWGTSINSYCMTTDGSFYPPVNTIECTQCSSPPGLDSDSFYTVQVNPGRFEFRCNPGFIGESTYTECNSISGIWNTPEPPYCDIAPTPSETPSITPSPSITPIFEEFPSPSQTPSETPSETPTQTPSASKSPRPPKVKGSRAPTQPPKLRPQY